MSTRDPRIIPKRGDVPRKGNTWRTVVYVEREPSMVQVLDGWYRYREKRPTLRQFRSWAANAIVEFAEE